LTTDIE